MKVITIITCETSYVAPEDATPENIEEYKKTVERDIVRNATIDTQINVTVHVEEDLLQ